jgi:hypothetical protein
MPGLNFILPAVAIVAAIILLRPAVRNATFWQATVTPLASIIGSGFLVVAPMLYLVTGKDAPWAMLGIVVGAYGIGAIIRFNIVHAEPMLHDSETPRHLRLTERGSDLILAVAYVISVAFYIRLLASFALDGIGIDGETPARLLTTAILIFIGGTGWWKGLKGLIQLEEYSVTIKLAVIAALLVGLAGFDPEAMASVPNLPPDQSWWEQARALAGLLLVVQGFETSRYLGQAFDAETRVRSMRLAQIVSGIIYVGFIVLIMPLLFDVSELHLDETAIIHMVEKVALLLPPLLIIGAMMSQFSAAVADTAGAGGLIAEETKLSAGSGYPVIVLIAIGLIWVSNIFEIIAYASQAFAAYYALQALVALQLTGQVDQPVRRWALRMAFVLAALVLVWVTIFAIPVG